MARTHVDKPHNGGKWSEARFNSFVKGGLRRLTVKWGPIQEAKKQARVKRGIYLCAGCGEEVPASIKVDGKRIPNVFVDHIAPVVDPKVGMISWDIVIERMFVELDGLQLLCKECHDIKSSKEREMAQKRRAYERRNA